MYRDACLEVSFVSYAFAGHLNNILPNAFLTAHKASLTHVSKQYVNERQVNMNTISMHTSAVYSVPINKRAYALISPIVYLLMLSVKRSLMSTPTRYFSVGHPAKNMNDIARVVMGEDRDRTE